MTHFIKLVTYDDFMRYLIDNSIIYKINTLRTYVYTRSRIENILKQ